MSSLGALEGHPIVPVVAIDDPDSARGLAEALAAGGIRCAEVVLRTPDAVQAIRAMTAVEGFVVGAGTVINRAQAVAVIEAGASFVVSPGFSDAVVSTAQAAGLGVLPGIATATEAMRAVAASIEVVKFFPADRLGGLAAIEALAAPLAQLRFVPSGGVTAVLAVDYLAHPAIASVSGSWMAPREAIAARDWARITRLSTEAVDAIGSR
jgi:2-dehydro-3-deoxyphosphogluconate aldolase / (4S)-4-hydroxy-2-oxoglutarate aldolase